MHITIPSHHISFFVVSIHIHISFSFARGQEKIGAGTFGEAGRQDLQNIYNGSRTRDVWCSHFIFFFSTACTRMRRVDVRVRIRVGVGVGVGCFL